MDISVAEISKRLADQAQTIAFRLLPTGKLESGRNWVCGDITGKPGESLKITLVGTYAGQWKDWSNDDHGDMLDLWKDVKGITMAQAVKEAKDYLGIVDVLKAPPQKAYAKAPQIVLPPMNEQGRAITYLKQDRLLKGETIAAYKVDAWPEKKALVFPSFSPAGELINRSYRTLTTPKQVWQDTGCAPSLFGWQAIPDTNYRSRTILISEGQLDAMTWFQWGIPAISIPNGAGMSWLDYEWENLSVFDTIYLAFDQDESGRKFVDQAVSRLGKHRCLIVAMPKKDANDCLKAGYDAKDAQDWYAAAKAPNIKKLVQAKEMESRLLAQIQLKPEPFTLPFFAHQWETQQGFWFRPGELTVWGGYTSSGKTTFLNFLQSNLLASAKRMFVASLEMKVEILLERLARIFMGTITEKAAKDFLIGAGEHLVYADIVGSMKQDDLFEMMWFAHRRYGCEHFMIDSLMRIEGLEENYPAQGEFTTRLQNFVKETGTHAHLVCHLAKPSGNKAGATASTSAYDIKGSSLLANNPDNVILISRNAEKDKLRKAGKLSAEQHTVMHDTEIYIEKQRDSGWTGLFKLHFHPHRYSYSKL